MEKLRNMAYAGWIVIPAMIFAVGCGGDPPPVPDEVEGTSIEEMQEEMDTGIDLGTEVGESIEPTGDGDATDSATAEGE